MARFTDQVGIQQQNLSTGFVQGSNTLLNRLQGFKRATEQLVDVTETKRGEAEAEQAIAEGKPFKRKEAGIAETILTGGVSTAAYNKSLETAYLSGIANDSKEAINAIEAENPSDITKFNDAAQSRVSGILKTVDPSVRNQVAEYLDGQVTNSRMRVHRNAIKRNKAEATASSKTNITNAGNEAARLSREGNVEGATEQLLLARATTQGLVESGEMSSDRASIVMREIERESTEQKHRKKFDDILEKDGVAAAEDELNELRGNAPKGFTPDEWDTYTNSQQAHINRQKAKASARSQTAAKEATKALKQYETAVSLGFDVDPQEKVRVKELVAGTPQQEQFDRINKTAAFSVLSIEDRNEQLNNLETGKLADVADLTAALRANNEINKMAIEDGYSLGVKQGLIQEVSFDPSDPLSLALKADQAETLSNHYGVPVSPLTDGEANSLSRSIDGMTAAEKVQLATTLNEAPEVWGQISPKNQQAFSMAGATGDNVLMATVFQGQELLKEKLVTAAKPSDYLATSDDFLADVYGTQDKAAILEAAKAHYAATVGNVDVFDTDAWETSLSAVTGGIGEVNGNKVELPRGVDEDTFEDFIDEFSGAQVSALGGVLGFDDDQAANAIQKGKIKSVGANKYIVMTNESQALFKANGEPLIIEFTAEQQAQQEAKKFMKAKTIESSIKSIRGF